MHGVPVTDRQQVGRPVADEHTTLRRGELRHRCRVTARVIHYLLRGGRAQIEGAVAQAIGATLYEHVGIDAGGQVTTRPLRDCPVPTFAGVPRTEVHFVRGPTPPARSAGSR